ncbi:MAG: hypothetical protein MJZ81_07565 [Bacteroidales bacterium]|nr:hypothetical protein [Bacteroidales bacterium]
MTTKTVTIGIDPEAGQVWVEEGTLFIGERTPIVLSGYEPEEGATLRLTVFDDDERTPLADNSLDSSVLDMRGDRLRKKFADTKVLGLSAFVVEVGADYSDVIAKGRFTVKWAPFVDDGIGELATLRGPKGDKGDEGHAGPMGPISQIKDPDTGKWYNVLARVDADGNRVVSLEQDDTPPVSGGDVATQGDLNRLGQDIEDELDEVRDDVGRLEEGQRTVEGSVTAVSGRVTDLEGSAVRTYGDQVIGGKKTFGSGLVFTTGYDPSDEPDEDTPDEIVCPIAKDVTRSGRTMTNLETVVYPHAGSVHTKLSAQAEVNGQTREASVMISVGDDGSVVTLAADRVEASGIAGAGFPSSFVIEEAMATPATGQKLTFANGSQNAPMNGWIYWSKTASAVGQMIRISVGVKDGSSFGDQYVEVFSVRDNAATVGSSGTRLLIASAPVPKGATVTLSYTASGATGTLRYIKAEGEVVNYDDDVL